MKKIWKVTVSAVAGAVLGAAIYQVHKKKNECNSVSENSVEDDTFAADKKLKIPAIRGAGNAWRQQDSNWIPA